VNDAVAHGVTYFRQRVILVANRMREFSAAFLIRL
jgi:hypothetical protein